MKKKSKKKYWLVICLACVMLLAVPEHVFGAWEEESIFEDILAELDMEELDRYTEESVPEEIRFSDVVNIILDEGFEGLDKEMFLEYIYQIFFYEISSLKPLLIQMICIAAVFALENRMIISKSGYLSQISFLMIYSSMMVLLLQSFHLVTGVVEAGMDSMLAFLTAFIPTYATTLIIGGNAVSAGVFYELAFGLIYVVEWASKTLLIPGIHIFLLLEFLDHLFEEEKLSRLADLVESGMQLFLKVSMGCVMGIGVVQSLLAPAKDRLSSNTVLQGMSAIPGVGNSIGTAGEVLLACGMVLKNSVGTAALILLVVICLTPVVQVFCFTLVYRLLAAILQPLADKRIVECVSGVSRGCTLYLKMILNAMLLFFIVIAMISISTSFVY